MCRFQLNQCRFQIEFNEVYRSHSLYFSSAPHPRKAQNIVWLVPFAHVSIPTQPVPIPDRVQWALSIPLIIFFLEPRSPATKPKILSKKRTKPAKIEKNRWSRFAHVSIPTQPVPIPDRVQWALSIATNYISLDPPHLRQGSKYQNKNRPKLRKTLVPFAHVSIPTQPVPIPDRVQWALSIPLIISFSSTPLTCRQSPKYREKNEQNRPKLRKTLVSFAHVSIPSQPVPIPDRVQWALSIPLIIFFLDPPHPRQSPKYREKNQCRTVQWGLSPKIEKNAGWSHSHMCRFQLNQCRFQIEFNELYRFH